MLVDVLLTIIGYHYFDYSGYNPYTTWIFSNLHWSVWLIAKIIVVFLVYGFIRNIHWVISVPFSILAILIMLGAVLYDWDLIFSSQLYSAYLGFFSPILKLPIISHINDFLWGSYSWF